MDNELTPLQSLTAARALIADPKHWTKNTYAKDVEGRSVPATDPEAFCFCSVGALYKVNDVEHMCQGLPGRSFLFKAAFEVSTKYFRDTQGPITLNDKVEHAIVMEMYDRAITLATEGEAA